MKSEGDGAEISFESEANAAEEEKIGREKQGFWKKRGRNDDDEAVMKTDKCTQQHNKQWTPLHYNWNKNTFCLNLCLEAQKKGSKETS